ncbi:hypothetical protein [Bacillus nitratireducens]|nr:hypothetical protein [Bacillus nitratireducens]QUG84691.1 hypothetical protein GSN03_15090 [Bacillus nitratireducens]
MNFSIQDGFHLFAEELQLSLHFIFISVCYYLDITMLYVVVTEIVKDF